MVFIYPEFLWGLLAIVIPVIIHLFDFRRNEKVEFPDIRFLKQVKHSSRKPLRLKQLLILISRLAFVFFLVMVFAQPILPTDSQKKLKSGTKLIYIDNSQSMSSFVSTKESAFDQAKAIGQNIIKQLPSGQTAIIVSNDDLHQFFVPNTLSEASEKISNINLSDKPFSMSQFASAVTQYVNRGDNVSDIFILSDFQKSTSYFDVNRFDSAINFWLARIPIETANNCLIDSVYLVSSDINTDGITEIEIIVNNNGDQEKENLPVKVFVGNRQVSAATISIPAYKKKRISFSLGNFNNAESGYIQIEDYPNTFDNVFYFSVPKKKLISVFEIKGESPSSYIEPVFGSKNLFLKRSNNYQNIENNLFEDADFMVLNQIENLERELVNKIKFFAENGGSVLVIPSIKTKINAYKNLSSAIKNTTLLKTQKLQAPSSKSPFFSTILEQSTLSIEMPSVTPVVSLGQDRSAILLLEDGTPYLSEIFPNIYMISSPLIDSLSNFQSHALFVPVMYSLAAKSVAPTNKLFARMQDGFYDLRIDSLKFKDIVKFSKEDVEIVPSKLKVGNYWRFSFPKEITNTGVYKISVAENSKGNLAINLDKNESDLTALKQPEIEQLFLDHNFNFMESFNANNSNSNAFNNGIALWKYALIICLLFLLTETLLIRFL